MGILQGVLPVFFIDIIEVPVRSGACLCVGEKDCEAPKHHLDICDDGKSGEAGLACHNVTSHIYTVGEHSWRTSTDIIFANTTA